MTSETIDRLSLASVLVDAYAGAPPSIGKATGFLLAVDGLILLVTNYHVSSGRHAETDAPIHPHFFWVDASGAQGMSGSPVVARRVGFMSYRDGSAAISTGAPRDQVVGVYSGRAHVDTSLGRVWRWDAALEVVAQCVLDVKAGRTKPRRGVLGTFEDPSDIRIPNALAGGVWMPVVAAAIASSAIATLSDARCAAILAAAAQAASESDALVIPHAITADLQMLLRRNAAAPGAKELLTALEAASHA